MKTLLVTLLIITSVKSFALGKFFSSDPREPQIIIVQENPDNTDRVLFKFCTTKEMKKCWSLAGPEGVLKTVLEKESNKQEKRSKIARYANPVEDLALFMVSMSVFGRIGKVGIAFIGGTLTMMGSDLINKESNSSSYKEELSLTLDPDQNFRIKLKLFETSISKYSYILEKKLRRMRYPCVEDQESQECKESGQWLKKRLLNPYSNLVEDQFI